MGNEPGAPNGIVIAILTDRVQGLPSNGIPQGYRMLRYLPRRTTSTLVSVGQVDIIKATFRHAIEGQGDSSRWSIPCKQANRSLENIGDGGGVMDLGGKYQFSNHRTLPLAT